MRKIEIFYPTFTKKALTFTIDDGNMKYDKMLLSILAPAGIKGTFNLCSNLHAGNEEATRSFYHGYDVANHCKHHPLVNYDGVEYVISDEEFDPATADKTRIYPHQGSDGFFWVMRPNGWRQMVFEKDFISYIKEGKEELEEILGREVRDFVWPYGRQDNAALHEYIKATHRSSRITGCTRDSDGFNIPSDKYAWSYNANDSDLLEVMELYERYPDDGKLKFFAFGVHSIDFERAGRWDVLREFAEKYGNRPDVYWYTTVGAVFDYCEALERLENDGTKLVNNSDTSIYFELDGERVGLLPGESIVL